MIDNSIDLSLDNIWKSWYAFRKGKKPTLELDKFQFNLETNLFGIHNELNTGIYKHGKYKTFIVSENKKREISVAPIRDRIVHRLIYDYLTPIYDKTFIYDVWSCRVGKGLLGAIERIQKFSQSYPDYYVWRADIKKFFDNVDHEILLKILSLKIKDAKTMKLMEEIIKSFPKGIPIGNLTSQIFANIYLNELDRFIKYDLKSKTYLRYGDDFILFERDLGELKDFQEKTKQFLEKDLKLELHQKNNLIFQAKNGIKILGVKIYPSSRKLLPRNIKRIESRLSVKNAGSYWGILKKHANSKMIDRYEWCLLTNNC